jgi:hypothetical protein
MVVMPSEYKFTDLLSTICAKCSRIRRSIGVAKVRNCVEPDNGARFDRGRAMLVAIDNASRRGRYRIEPESIEVVS